MNTAAHANLLADLFTNNGLGVLVTLRLADNPGAAVTLWPYAVDDNHEARNNRLPFPRPEVSLPQKTHILVLPNTVDTYDRARKIVLDNPVLTSGGAPVRVVIEDVPPDVKSSLFLSSGVEYRLGLFVVVG